MLETILKIEREDPATWLRHFLEFCQETSASKPGRKRQDETKVFDFTRLTESRLALCFFCAEGFGLGVQGFRSLGFRVRGSGLRL